MFLDQRPISGSTYGVIVSPGLHYTEQQDEIQCKKGQDPPQQYFKPLYTYHRLYIFILKPHQFIPLIKFFYMNFSMKNQVLHFNTRSFILKQGINLMSLFLYKFLSFINFSVILNSRKFLEFIFDIMEKIKWSICMHK